jgi:phage tail-like protein
MPTPLTVFNFRVYFSPEAPELTTLDVGNVQATAQGLAGPTVTSLNSIGFAEVRGFHSELEVEDYREGGRNIGPRRFPKWGRYSTLICQRGVTSSPDLWNWWMRVISQSYTLPKTAQPPPQPVPRRNGVILLESLDHQAVAGWFFSNALPERLVGPGLNARSNEIAIETLELSHEGLLRLPDRNLPRSV